MFEHVGNEFIWFIGVVEDRQDPLQLGRVRVRAFGHHTANKIDIPTEDLPWAHVMMPNSSAMMNGIGQSPLGLVEGTHVIGYFKDGKSLQQPLIMGSIGGTSTSPFFATRSLIETTEEQRKVVYNGGKKANGELVEELQEVKDNSKRHINLLVVHCSATTPNVDCGAKEIDLWHRQKGWDEIGYHFVIRRNGVVEKGRSLAKQGAHTSGFNATSIGICLIGGVDEDKRPQNNFTQAQWRGLTNLLDQYTEEYPGIKIIGHNEVSNKACPSFDVQSYLKDNYNGSLSSGTNLKSLVEEAIPEGKIPLSISLDQDLDVSRLEAYRDDIYSGTAEENESLPENNYGFVDPNAVYPREDYINEQHINRLSRGILEGTVIASKNENIDVDVSIGSTDETWSEPLSAYSALYPYNHVHESESGHIKEIDDTPGSERLHEYHRSGTFEEIHPDGTRVQKIVGSNYEIITKDNNVLIKGSCNINIVGDSTLNVSGNIDAFCAGNINIENDGRTDIKSKGEIKIKSDTHIEMSAPRIDFNNVSNNSSGGLAGAFNSISGGF